MRLIQNRSEIEGVTSETPTSSLRFQSVVSYGTGDEIRIEGFGDDGILLTRFLACQAVCMMPEQSLNEVIGSLKEIWEYHSEVPIPSLMPRNAVHLDSGQLTGIATRPPLFIESEE